MKKILGAFIVFTILISACKENKTSEKEINKKENTQMYLSFGEKISDKGALSASEMLAKFKTIGVSDTINIKFASKINDVCSKKGCWMKLPLDSSTETMVRFKDYGFFMPLDSKEKEVIVEGKAFVKETSIEELKHYAEDAGKSKEEIDNITESKIEYAFLANGVLMKK